MQDNQDNIETKSHLKRDLIKVVILTLFFCAVLVGFEIVDNQTGHITELANKIASFFVK